MCLRQIISVDIILLMAEKNIRLVRHDTNMKHVTVVPLALPATHTNTHTTSVELKMTRA